jgi:hypothetical protein
MALKDFGSSLKLSTPMPADLYYTDLGNRKLSRTKPIDGEQSVLGTTGAHVKFATTPQSSTYSRDSSFESLKKFGEAFKLSTPLPEDLQYIIRRQPGNDNSKQVDVASKCGNVGDEQDDFQQSSVEQKLLEKK